jgi:hypothetical protein
MSEPSAEQLPEESVLQSVREWMSRPNVVGLSIGEKTVAGSPTGQRAVLVHVVEKRPAVQLSGEEDFLIPARIEVQTQQADGSLRAVSVPTDVLEVGESELQVLDQRLRPCPGGYQVIAKATNISGTLGVNMVWRGRYRLLASNHVISENGNVGLEVFQPQIDPNDPVGALTGYVPVVTYPSENEQNPVENKQDLAWCDIGKELGAPKIHIIGLPKGHRQPKVGDTVRLVGKQTGTEKTARIVSVTLKTKLKWPIGGTRWAWFGSLIQLDQVVTVPGDSGAAYVAADDFVVGLHVAANQAYSWGCGVSE